MIVGDSVADFCDGADSEVRIPTGLVREFVGAEQAKLDRLSTGRGTEDASVLRGAMQDIMTAKVGIFRTGSELAAAVAELQVLLERSRRIGLKHGAPGANPELVTAYRVQKMLKLALCIAHGAAQRTESRGAHFREDFPRRDDARWLKRTLATWRDEADTLPTLAYEALDVDAMELPPGWRGYGTKDHIDHPRTAPRAAEVAAIRERTNGASRHAVQQALMPYQDLLPPRLRGNNERIDEPL
jgi:fumarate reductase flavoprotein subunit